MLIGQIVRSKLRNLELCFGTNVRTNQWKFEKNSISRAIWFGFLRCLVSATRCEANKSTRYRKEISSLTVKMSRDLRWRAWRGLAQHTAAANARVEVRALMHNWSIWCQGSSRTIGWVMVHSKTFLLAGNLHCKTQRVGGSRSFCRFRLVCPVH